MATAISYSPISSESRVRILALLAEQPDRTIDDLTAATGLHSNTVREHLQRLIDLGFVLQTTEHRTVRGRPRSLYRVADGTPDASSPVARRKVRESAERGDLMRAVMPETVAEGLTTDEQHQLDAMIDHLDETGFAPTVDERDLTIDLSPCAHVQSANTETTRCAVHLSLIQSVLTEAGGPLAVGGMRPGCNPRDCVIQLLRRED